MYVYLISTGAYSSYNVEYIAIHKRKFKEEELKSIMENVKKEYVNGGYPTEDYHVVDSKVESILIAKLDASGFKVVFPVGEFHYNDYSKVEDISADIPWRAKGEHSVHRERF